MALPCSCFTCSLLAHLCFIPFPFLHFSLFFLVVCRKCQLGLLAKGGRPYGYLWLQRSRRIDIWIFKLQILPLANLGAYAVMESYQSHIFRNCNNKAFHMTSKSIGAHERMTHDLERLITDLSSLVTGMVRLIVDILWFTWRMKPLIGQRSFTVLHAYMLLGKEWFEKGKDRGHDLVDRTGMHRYR